jgi:hypothetical protein
LPTVVIDKRKGASEVGFAKPQVRFEFATILRRDFATRWQAVHRPGSGAELAWSRRKSITSQQFCKISLPRNGVVQKGGISASK